MDRVSVEVCVDSIDSLNNAIAGGAGRKETKKTEGDGKDGRGRKRLNGRGRKRVKGTEKTGRKRRKGTEKTEGDGKDGR